MDCNTTVQTPETPIISAREEPVITLLALPPVPVKPILSYDYTEMYHLNEQLKQQQDLKLWNAMEDENAIYVLLGSELQGKVNYCMPVKDVLYDAFGYSKQIEEARRSIKETNHRKIDRDTAFFLNRAVNLGLEYEEKDGGIDMCLAMEKKIR